MTARNLCWNASPATLHLVSGGTTNSLCARLPRCAICVWSGIPAALPAETAMLSLTSQDEYESSLEIEVLRAALDSYAERFGPHHPLVLDVVERLAVAFWHHGEVSEAVTLLNHTLESLSDQADQDDAVKEDLLGLLWKIMFAQGHFEVSDSILLEIHARCVRRGGEYHADSLAAQGDRAIVLFAAGKHEEAEALGRDALERARQHLGTTDRVTCILAWNRVLLHERRNDFVAARDLAEDSLMWILAEDPARMDADLREIREWLADRFGRDTAPVC
jgi:tetratricopeptide (TPR) repeat protein